MSNLSLLWDYQQTELELAKLNKEMKSSQAYQKRSKLQRLLREQQGIVEGYSSDIDAHTSQISTFSAQLQALMHDYDLEKSELDIMLGDEEATVEELTESKKSIEKLVGKINALNRELNSMLEWCSSMDKSVTETYAKAMRAKRDYDAVRTVCDAEKETFPPRIDELTKLLDEKKADIPAALLNEYTDLKKNYGAPIARLVNGQCSGCFMELPSSVQRKVADEKNIVRCENCGRILYLKQ